MTLSSFFSSHPVFGFEEAVRTLAPQKSRRAMVDRLKHHVRSGALQQVTRGVYAVVSPAVDAELFRPDPFLVARALRSDALFSHHSALELLGASHTTWNRVTFFSARKRKSLTVHGTMYTVVQQPEQMLGLNNSPFAVRIVERRGTLLTATGPERTLVEGFRRPALVGGLEELVHSAAGFAVLDLNMLQEVLQRYHTARLWAAVAWFLERFRREFHVPDQLLATFEQRIPSSPQYVERQSRGGVLVKRWNLILPASLAGSGEPNEP
jgi:predicted transcriptional regulator of viral defense system